MRSHHAAGISIVQDINEEQAFCKVKVNGPLGHFCGDLLIDTGCTMELRQNRVPVSWAIAPLLASRAGNS